MEKKLDFISLYLDDHSVITHNDQQFSSDTLENDAT